MSAFVTSCSTPTMPMLGVGKIAPVGVSLYSEAFPEMTGVPRARAASDRPMIASSSW